MINLFVYGTLQPGDYNFPWIEDAMLGDPKKGTIDGTIYHVSDRPWGFPVAKLDEVGTIHGTVLPVDENTQAYRDTKRMEEGAGYVVQTVPCRLADGSEIEVQAFHYLRAPRGAQIPSGDWLGDKRKALGLV